MRRFDADELGPGEACPLPKGSPGSMFLIIVYCGTRSVHATIPIAWDLECGSEGKVVDA